MAIYTVNIGGDDGIAGSAIKLHAAPTSDQEEQQQGGKPNET
jgi:hypothetical protein